MTRRTFLKSLPLLLGVPLMACIPMNRVPPSDETMMARMPMTGFGMVPIYSEGEPYPIDTRLKSVLIHPEDVRVDENGCRLMAVGLTVEPDGSYKPTYRYRCCFEDSIFYEPKAAP